VSAPDLDGTHDTHTNLSRRALDRSPAAPGRSRARVVRRRRALAALLAVVLLAGGSAAGWWWTGRDDGTAPASGEREPAGNGRPDASVSAGPAAGQTAPVPVWTRWTALPVAPIVVEGGPAAAQAPGDRPYVLVRDTSGQPWYTSREGGRWADWQRLPAFRAAEDLAVVAPAPGRLEVFAVSAGEKLLHRVTFADGRWGSWTRLDARTKITGAPAAAAAGDRVDLVVRTGDALAAGTATNGAFGGFTTVPSAGRVEEAPALTASGPGALEAFVVRAGDHALLRVPYDQGTWREPERVGVSASARPAAVRSEATGLVVVVRDRDGRLVTAALGADGQWRTATSSGQVADGAAATAADGRVEVWTRATGGRVQTGMPG
jgi:hypothetical protein